MTAESPAEVIARCPHCLEGVDDPLAHFMNGATALLQGRELCTRAAQRIGRMDYWGWGCPSPHTCYTSRVPAVPPVDPYGG